MKLAFTGDCCVTGSFLSAFQDGKPLLSEPLQKRLQEHDFVVANWEGAETKQTISAKTTGIALHNPLGAASHFARFGVNVFALANNHLFDYGLEGFHDTVAAVEGAGGQCLGAGMNEEAASKPLVLKAGSEMVALLNFAHEEGPMAEGEQPGVFSGRRWSIIRQRLAEARKVARWVVAVYHGGEEFTRYPAPNRRSYLQRLARLGFDAVIAHHPHVVQGMEWVSGCLVFYSLGNFVLDLPHYHARNGTETGLIVSLTFGNAGVQPELLPIHLDRQRGQVELLPQAVWEAQWRERNDFSRYRKRWRKEAAQVFAQRKVAAATASGNSESQSTGTSSTFSKIKTLFRMLQDESMRPLVLAWLEQQVRSLWAKPEQE